MFVLHPPLTTTLLLVGEERVTHFTDTERRGGWVDPFREGRDGEKEPALRVIRVIRVIRVVRVTRVIRVIRVVRPSEASLPSLAPSNDPNKPRRCL